MCSPEIPSSTSPSFLPVASQEAGKEEEIDGQTGGARWRETEEAQCPGENLGEAGQEAPLSSEDPDPPCSPHRVDRVDLAVTSCFLELYILP